MNRSMALMERLIATSHETQPGCSAAWISALAWGARGRVFKSRHPDFVTPQTTSVCGVFSLPFRYPFFRHLTGVSQSAGLRDSGDGDRVSPMSCQLRYGSPGRCGYRRWSALNTADVSPPTFEPQSFTSRLSDLAAPVFISAGVTPACRQSIQANPIQSGIVMDLQSRSRTASGRHRLPSGTLRRSEGRGLTGSLSGGS